jgi:preprotein translocase subunit SecD
LRRNLIWSLVFMFVLAGGALAATIGTGHSPLLGLDLRGGVSVVLKPSGPAAKSELSEAVNIIDRRVNGLGVSNSEVAVQGSDVVINLPGIKNSQQALAELGTTAELYFRPVYCVIPPYAPASTSTTTSRPSPATTAPASTATTVPASTTTTAPANQAVSQADCGSAAAASLPSTTPDHDNPAVAVILPNDPKTNPSVGNERYILGPADLTGTAVSNAVAELNPTTGQYSVALTLTSSGGAKFDSFAAARYACTQQNPSNPPPCAQEAFELDGEVISAPDFQAASFNGNVSITGNFTSSQARTLAEELKYGALPVRFVPQSVQTVSATIGRDSLRAGLAAGIGGIVVVMLYMLLYYRALGLVVLVGLGVGGSILYSVISLLSTTENLTLTLAGVTGIIVSVGITVDSYVVYFERLKDEVRAGRSVRQSVEKSFSRAFRTVLTADLVSFMAALILYLFTIGDVRGFAYTLGLSTLLDVATAFFFIRPAVILVGRRRGITDNRVFGIARGLGARPAGGG